MGPDSQQFEFLDLLTIISFCIQIQNVQKHNMEISNDELMKELQEQDRKYLEKIIANQENILSLLNNIQADKLTHVDID